MASLRKHLSAALTALFLSSACSSGNDGQLAAATSPEVSSGDLATSDALIAGDQVGSGDATLPVSEPHLCTKTGWCLEQPLTPSAHGGLCGSAVNDLWRLSDSGDGSFPSSAVADPPIMHYDGVTWQVIEAFEDVGATKLPSRPSTCYALAPNDAWFVGRAPALSSNDAKFAVYRWDGTFKRVHEFAVVDADFPSIWASSSSDVWIHMSAGLQHFDGAAWTALPGPGSDTNRMFSFSGCGPGHVWAVTRDGDDNDQQLWEWADGAWTKAVIEGSKPSYVVLGHLTDCEHLYAGTGFDGELLAYANGKWSRVPGSTVPLTSAAMPTATSRLFTAVWVVSGTVLAAIRRVADVPLGFVDIESEILRWDHGAWITEYESYLDAASYPDGHSDDGDTESLRGKLVGNVPLAVGARWYNQVAMVRDEETWETIRDTGNARVADTLRASADDNVWIFDGASMTSMVDHFDGARWSPVRIEGARITGIAPVGHSDAWSAAGGTIYRWADGAFIPDTTLPTAVDAHDVAASSMTDAWVAGTSIAHLHAATWTVEVDGKGTDSWACIWTHDDDVVAFGTALAHRTGGEWALTAAASPEVPLPATSRCEIVGNAPDNVWLIDLAYVFNSSGSYTPNVLHWDGATWTLVDATPGDSLYHAMNALTVTSDGAVLGCKRYGALASEWLFRWNGTAFEPDDDIPVLNPNPNPVSGGRAGCEGLAVLGNKDYLVVSEGLWRLPASPPR